MKKIYIIRHASAEAPGLKEDRKRELTKKGCEEAEHMAGCLCKEEIKDCKFISSPAARAFRTAGIFAKATGYAKGDIITSENFYSASPSEMLEEVKSRKEKNDIFLLFGHNPSFSYLCEMFVEGFTENLPKCCVVGVEFPVSSWKDIAPKSGKLFFIDYPKSKKKMVSRIPGIRTVIMESVTGLLNDMDPDAAKLIHKKVFKAADKIAFSFLRCSSKIKKELLNS